MNKKEVVVNFSDLIKIKKKYDEIEKKVNNIGNNCIDLNLASFLLAKKDALLHTFLMTGKIYYKIPDLTIERLNKLYEEELKYQTSLNNKSSVNVYYKPSIQIIDDEEDFNFTDEDEAQEIIEIMKGN